MKILFGLATFLNLFGESLVNSETGSIVVTFVEDKIQFNDRFLELEMRETGIFIPSSQTKDFGEKEIVYLGDPLFEKAFVEIYYPLCIANSLYQWEAD